MSTPPRPFTRVSLAAVTWTKLSNALWSARYYHAAVPLGSATIVLMAGYTGIAYLNDVFRSTDFGGGSVRLV
jgi:hypothetical protein